MRTYHIFVLLFFACYVEAQRRTTSTESPRLETPRSHSRGRGRSRFVSTADLADIADELGGAPELLTRRTPSRKRVPEIKERKFTRITENPHTPSYEVEEIINDSPIEAFLRKGRPKIHSQPPSDIAGRSKDPTEPLLEKSLKPRILTESRFEIPSRSKTPSEPLFKPRLLTESRSEPSVNLNRPIKARTFSETRLDTLTVSRRNLVSTTLPTSLNDIPDFGKLPDISAPNLLLQDETTQVLDEITTIKASISDDIEGLPQNSEEQRSDIPKTPPLTTSIRPIELRRPPTVALRRNSLRNRGSLSIDEAVTIAPRVRSRTRATRKPDQEATVARKIHRHDIEVNQSPRANQRGSRRRPEPIHFADVAKKGPSVFGAEPYPIEPRSRPGRRIDVTPEKLSIDIINPRKDSSRSATLSRESYRRQVPDTIQHPTFPSRSRTRSIPTFDESKIEVLPLFESEPNTVAPVIKSRSRSRSSNNYITENSRPQEGLKSGNRRSSTFDDIQTSPTENDLQYRRPDSSRVTVSVNIETRTESTVRRQQRKPQVRESVIAEVSEVTSKRTVSRRKSVNGKVTTVKPRLFVDRNSARGSKKSEIKLTFDKDKRDSEEVDESDNYPEAFKAIIQAKKNKKETRLSERVKSFSTSSTPVSNLVISSVPPVSTAVSSEAVRDKNLADIEVDAFRQFKTERPVSNRFSITTKTPATTPHVSSKRNSLPSKRFNKVMRSTAVPSSTTVLPKNYPRFSEKKEKVLGNLSKNSSRGTYSKIRREDRGSISRERSSVIEDPILLSPKVSKPPSSVKKQNRFQSKYRTSISSRGNVRSTTNAPAYIPTIPSVPYIPTVPTVTPPSTAKVFFGDDELDVIFFNDPVNTIPSANLIREDYISSTEKTIKIPAISVIDGTTEKPVSIIERIINSITAISTPEPLADTSNTTTMSTTESNSAILKLTNKKTDKTKPDIKSLKGSVENQSITTDKPTTIIEKILSSISAIQATDDTNSVQVGKDFNTISSSSTTPIPKVTKITSSSTLLAPSSTSINPLSVLDEISPDQVLEKRTIGKLLDILNGLKSTTISPEKLVVVTPKSTFSPSVNIYDALPNTPTSLSLNSNALFTPTSTYSPTATSTDSSTINSDENISTTSSLFMVSTTPNVQSEESSLDMRASTIDDMLATSTTTDSNTVTETVPIMSTESTTSSNTAQTTNSPTTSTEATTFPTITEVGLNSTTETVSLFTLLSTLPSLQKFEVSPGSVKVFSANDISNSITPEDNSLTTVTISSRSNFDNTITTISSTTPEDVTTEITLTTENLTDMITVTVNDSTTSGSTMNNDVSTTPFSSPNRSGRLLNIVQDPVLNSIELSPSTTTSTAPDYFIFAVLNNNTILRKKPPTIPNKDTPFVIVGVYPNNTIVRKFPNGTIVPMDPVIRVSGFDTRENPPPLSDITSNQVTNDSGSMDDGRNLQTVDQNNVSTNEANPKLLVSVVSNSTIEGVSHSTNTTALITSGNYSSSSISTDTSSSTTTPPLYVVTYITHEPITNDTPDASTEVPTLRTARLEVTEPSVSSILSTSTEGNTQTSNPTPPTLSIRINGKTIDDFNNLINSSTNTGARVNTESNIQTLQVNKVESTVKDGFTSTSSISLIPTTEGADINEVQPVRSTVTTTADTSTTTRKVETTTETPTTSTRRVTSITPRLTSTPTSVTLLPKTVATTPSTFFPTFLTTFFPNIFGVETTTRSVPRITTPKLSTLPLEFTETILVSASTSQPTTVQPPRTTSKTTTPKSTTAAQTTTTIQTTSTTTTLPPSTTTSTPTTTTSSTQATTTTTTQAPTTTRSMTRTTPASTISPIILTTRKTTQYATSPFPQIASSTRRSVEISDFNTISVTPTTSKIKQKQLTEEQKQNLETLAKLEKEQAALMQQLSFLTSLGNFGGANRIPKNSGNNLANRVIALAKERDKTTPSTSKEILNENTSFAPKTTIETTTKSSTRSSTKTTVPTTKIPNSIQDQLEIISDEKKTSPSLEDVLKQYNLDGLDISTRATSKYGSSNDAILASILKEQGIVPSTPKSLGEQIKESGLFTETTKRSRPRTTTPRPGRLMQGLNWLLNALAPPTTTRRPKPVKPKKPPVDQEFLANSPTHVTPVITPAPAKLQNTLNKDDIQKLIRQLEDLKRDPSKGALDLSQIKSLQHLINIDSGVEVLTNGEHGQTSRSTSTTKTTTTKRAPRKITATESSIESNSVENLDDLFTSTTSRTTAPLGFKPVPGVDDGGEDSLIRGNLITAAVNVTKAISGFLGSALQGAAHSFQNLLGSGSRLASNFGQGSAAG